MSEQHDGHLLTDSQLLSGSKDLHELPRTLSVFDLYYLLGLSAYDQGWICQGSWGIRPPQHISRTFPPKVRKTGWGF